MPIALGYFAVSFTLGIIAKQSGLTAFQAALMSFTNLTSAGQFSAMQLIASGSSYGEIALTQLIINLRYLLMAFALSQKFRGVTPFVHRFFAAAGITDEIFALSIKAEERAQPHYMYGMMAVAVPGWTLGTYAGVMLGNVLPTDLLSALSIALYAMLIAAIVPAAKHESGIGVLIALSMFVSFAFTKLPFVRDISSGTRIILITLLIAGAAAVWMPIEEENHEA